MTRTDTVGAPRCEVRFDRIDYLGQTRVRAECECGWASCSTYDPWVAVEAGNHHLIVKHSVAVGGICVGDGGPQGGLDV